MNFLGKPSRRSEQPTQVDKCCIALDSQAEYNAKVGLDGLNSDSTCRDLESKPLDGSKSSCK